MVQVVSILEIPKMLMSVSFQSVEHNTLNFSSVLCSVNDHDQNIIMLARKMITVATVVHVIIVT